MESSESQEARIYIRVGDIEIDLSGEQQEVDGHLMKIMEGEEWSTALAKIRSKRDSAISAAIEAAKNSGLPNRGSAFKTLIDSCKITKKPDRVLAAIHYLKDVEGVNDLPPRVIMDLFSDAELEPPKNLSLYLNRLFEKKFLSVPSGSSEKNRNANLTSEGRAHLDKLSKK
ncbi:MAG: Uncharacterised protein [Methanobacteriota archaeon]|nr:MAG: Uncharacterised protein [Euryarchaeota archaeon]